MLPAGLRTRTGAPHRRRLPGAAASPTCSPTKLDECPDDCALFELAADVRPARCAGWPTARKCPPTCGRRVAAGGEVAGARQRRVSSPWQERMTRPGGGLAGSRAAPRRPQPSRRARTSSSSAAARAAWGSRCSPCCSPPRWRAPGGGCCWSTASQNLGNLHILLGRAAPPRIERPADRRCATPARPARAGSPTASGSCCRRLRRRGALRARPRSTGRGCTCG